ncbi:MAG: hypothetical protein N2C14_04445, partial [Planctomycetales bacterium]
QGAGWLLMAIVMIPLGVWWNVDWSKWIVVGLSGIVGAFTYFQHPWRKVALTVFYGYLVGAVAVTGTLHGWSYPHFILIAAGLYGLYVEVLPAWRGDG